MSKTTHNIWVLSMPAEFAEPQFTVDEANWEFNFLPSARNCDNTPLSSWEGCFPALLFMNTSLSAQIDEVAHDEKEFSQSVDIVSHLLDEHDNEEEDDGQDLFQLDLDSLDSTVEASLEEAYDDNPYDSLSFDDAFSYHPTPIVCKFFVQGTCKAGFSCRYSHDTTNITNSPSSSVSSSHSNTNSARRASPPYEGRKPRHGTTRTYDVCPYYLEGGCKYGSSCRYQHVKPEEARKPKLNEESLKKLSTIPCKYFNFGAGVCPFGSSCYYLHQGGVSVNEQVSAQRMESKSFESAASMK